MSPQRTSGHRMSPQLTSGHRMSPQIRSGHRMSLQRTSGHRMSPQITSGHRMSPQITSGHRMSLQRTIRPRRSSQKTKRHSTISPQKPVSRKMSRRIPSRYVSYVRQLIRGAELHHQLLRSTQGLDVDKVGIWRLPVTIIKSISGRTAVRGILTF